MFHELGEVKSVDILRSVECDDIEMSIWNGPLWRKFALYRYNSAISKLWAAAVGAYFMSTIFHSCEQPCRHCLRSYEGFI